MFVTLIQVSQIESENKRKRSRHAPKGQRAHSPGHRPGYDEAMKCALKGRVFKIDTKICSKKCLFSVLLCC